MLLEERKLCEDKEACFICQYGFVNYLRQQGSPLMTMDVTCWQPSKKKNLLTPMILTSMTELAAMTASRLIMFRTRMMLSTTYPAPARDFPKQPITM